MEMTAKKKISLRTVWEWERKANRAIIVKSAVPARRSNMSDNATVRKQEREETKLIEMPRTNRLGMYVRGLSSWTNLEQIVGCLENHRNHTLKQHAVIFESKSGKKTTLVKFLRWQLCDRSGIELRCQK